MTVQYPESTPPQIDYTSRDYSSIREDLINRVRASVPDWDPSDPSDFGVALVESFAYLGDLLSYYIDRAANESSLATATRRDSVITLARDLGYSPAGYRSSRVEVEFTNSSSSSVVLPAGTVVSANITSGDTSVNVPFETDDPITVPGNGVASVPATQGRISVGDFGYGQFLGVSDGTSNQTYVLDTDAVVLDGVQVFVYDLVNYIPWSRIDQFADYGPLARVFQAVLTGAGTVEIKFGDGVSGLIPTYGQTVFLWYNKTDGSLGNVPAGSITEIDEIPGLGNASALAGVLSVTNNAAATGGSDPESTESIRQSAPLAYRTANRAVTLEDYQNIALSVTGCGKASAQSLTPSSVVVSVAPDSNGQLDLRPGYTYQPSTDTWVEGQGLVSLKEAVASKLKSTSMVSTNVAVVGPSYIDVFIGVSVDLEDSVRQPDAEVLIKQAILMKMGYPYVPFGAKVYPADLISLVSNLGSIVRNVSVTRLNIVGTSSDDIGVVTAEEDEILTVAEANIEVTMTGGSS